MDHQESGKVTETVYQRVGKLEQQMHTVRYQLDEFRKLPPRISDLEKVVGTMNASLSHIEKDNAEIKDGVKQIHDAQMKYAGDISGIGTAIKMGTGLIGFAAIGTAIVIWLVAL